mmetsp:Transcript_19127/g.33542  ORF Transcript_19127/g.33542 Transcript_19127/m.33542 type:complete len:92 (+) Transcript_19127:323-598(+)
MCCRNFNFWWYRMIIFDIILPTNTGHMESLQFSDSLLSLKNFFLDCRYQRENSFMVSIWAWNLTVFQKHLGKSIHCSGGNSYTGLKQTSCI